MSLEDARLLADDSEEGLQMVETSEFEEPVLGEVEDDRAVTQRPNKLSLVVVLVVAMTLSVEYAVIIPSVWLYLKSFDSTVTETMLGLVIGCYGGTSLVLQPLIGFWIDTRRCLKEVIVFQVWAVVFGNLLYFIAWSVPMVIVSRIVSGVGGTIFLSVSVYIIRSTTEEQRSPAFAMLQACMMLGMVVGPALNYPLSKINELGWVTQYSAVGLFMAIVQLVALAIFHAGFVEPLPPLDFPEAPTLTVLAGIKSLSSVLSFPTLSLMISQFAVVFNQSSLEVVLTPILLQYYGFHQVENSLFYCATSVYMIGAFAFVGGLLAKRFTDRILMMCGWISLVGGIVILLLCEINLEPHMPIWAFSIGIAIFVTATAFFESSVGSLFSKLVTRQGGQQAASQSVLMMFQTLATIFGPIAVSPVLTLGFVWVLFFNFCVWAVSFLFFCLAFQSLKLD